MLLNSMTIAIVIGASPILTAFTCCGTLSSSTRKLPGGNAGNEVALVVHHGDIQRDDVDVGRERGAGRSVSCLSFLYCEGILGSSAGSSFLSGSAALRGLATVGPGTADGTLLLADQHSRQHETV